MIDSFKYLVAAAALAAGVALSGLAGVARADVAPVPMPGDTKLVMYSYDPNNTYTVLARPGAITDIQLHSAEKLKAVALGDNIQWMVAKTAGHIFIKPLVPDIFTSATVVTDQRTYQLTLRSSPLDGKWFQRISWEYPDLIIFEMKEAEKLMDKEAAEQERLANVVVTPQVSPDQLNFDYAVKGDVASLKPSQVFDDGTFTWFRTPSSWQEMPAIFMVDVSGDPALVNYTVRGDYLVVQRLAPAFLLKLGKVEVQVVNNKQKKPSNFFSKLFNKGS
jgi:P-type conjugative transfer protein VirB9